MLNAKRLLCKPTLNTQDAVLVESKEEQAHLSELHREEQGIAAGQDDVGAGKLPAYADRAAGLDGAHQSVESASLVDDAYLQHEERALRQAKASLHRYALDQEGELWRSQKANQYWEHKDKELADHRFHASHFVFRVGRGVHAHTSSAEHGIRLLKLPSSSSSLSD
jgi:hypothetical protein